MTTLAGGADRTPDLVGSAAGPAPATRRGELSAFLRSRRERVRPEDVGLPPGGRRRTPGLRREEVAQLSGVGVTWYTWLEQGRDINVSAQVIDAIARTLRLDRHEWSHLSTLSGIARGPEPDQCAAVPDAVHRILSRVSPFPACVLNDRMDLLAYNRPYGEVIIDLDAIPVAERNLLWLAFTCPAWRASLVDCDRVTARLVASFRSAMASHLGESPWEDLVRRLIAASPAFAALWERHDVAPPGQRVKLVDSSRVGTLRLESANLWLSRVGGVRLVVYTPMDDETAERIERLGERTADSSDGRSPTTHAANWPLDGGSAGNPANSGGRR